MRLVSAYGNEGLQAARRRHPRTACSRELIRRARALSFGAELGEGSDAGVRAQHPHTACSREVIRRALKILVPLSCDCACAGNHIGRGLEGREGGP
jgi:hypothetical protein